AAAGQPRLDEPGEQRMGVVGAAPELGMGLGGDEERMVDQLDELDEVVVGRQPRQPHARRLQVLAVAVVHLPAVAVALVDELLAVRSWPYSPRPLEPSAGLAAYRPSRIVPPRSSTSCWLAIRSITGCGVEASNSVLLASTYPSTERANSITAHCSPKQRPRKGTPFSRA